ncbi:MAG TPA: response regulator [bacterium]|nr:response regulator [bacterium]
MTRILLIEDNADHAELIERSLKKGFGPIRLKVAASAEEAYETLDDKKFDLILSDYYLPDVDGDEHIRQLSLRAPRVPVVIITGQGDEKVAAKSIQSGAEDYIVKTREALEVLPTILKRAMVKHRSHQSKKQKEIRKHLNDHEEKVKKVLGEVEKIGRRMRNLTKRASGNGSAKPEDSGTLDNLARQIESLKKFVKGFFKK